MRRIMSGLKAMIISLSIMLSGGTSLLWIGSFFLPCLVYSLPVSALTDREQMINASLSTEASGSHTSGEDPEKASDKVFVVDSGPGLDTGCKPGDGNSLEIKLPIKRVIGNVDKLINSGVLKGATLTLPISHLMDDWDKYYPPAIDKIYLNGKLLSSVALIGNFQPRIIKLDVPLKQILFPIDPLKGGAAKPVDNIIKIDFDTHLLWCKSVDWVQLKLNISAVPVVLVHGWRSDGSTWANSMLKQEIDKIGLPNSGNEVSLDKYGTFDSRLPTLIDYINRLAAIAFYSITL